MTSPWRLRSKHEDVQSHRCCGWYDAGWNKHLKARSLCFASCLFVFIIELLRAASVGVLLILARICSSSEKTLLRAVFWTIYFNVPRFSRRPELPISSISITRLSFSERERAGPHSERALSFFFFFLRGGEVKMDLHSDCVCWFGRASADNF